MAAKASDKPCPIPATDACAPVGQIMVRVRHCGKASDGMKTELLWECKPRHKNKRKSDSWHPMACKDMHRFKPIIRDDTTQNRRDYFIDRIKDFVFFFAVQSRLWRQNKEKSFSLNDTQLLTEIAKSQEVTATQLGLQLNIDEEELQNTLHDLYFKGLVSKASDSYRELQMHYSLTELGRSKQNASDVDFRNNVAKTLETMSTTEQICLVDSVNAIKTILDLPKQPNVPFSIRCHQPGDMGWILHRHGVLYFQEQGWRDQLEAVTAEITANFLRNYDPKMDRCFIAERNSEIVGSVLLVNTADGLAQLRLLLVEPSARGLGIGSHLVNKCIEFAQQAGYIKIILWTHKVLHSARRIYEAAGFIAVKEKTHKAFGQEVVGQTWELKL